MRTFRRVTQFGALDSGGMNPKWVEKFNTARPTDKYRGKTWELLHDSSTYVAAEMDNRLYEGNLQPLGRTFPNQYGDNKYRQPIGGSAG